MLGWLVGMTLKLVGRGGAGWLAGAARKYWPVLAVLALALAWRVERDAYGDRRFDDGAATRQALIDTETDALNDKITDLTRQNETIAEELDRERIAAQALERALADQARRDPDAGSPGIGRAGRLRIDATR